MSYFSRMPAPRPYYQSYYTGSSYDDYNCSYDSYGSYSGGYAPARPARGSWRGGRGRGAWTGGRGGATGGGTTGSTLTTVKTVPTAALTTTAAQVKTEVKTEAKTEIKTEPGTATAATAKTNSVPNGGSVSAASAGGQTFSTAAAAAKVSTTTAADSKTSTTSTTVDTPLSDDHPFPESVTEKFFPNRCDLCSVVFPVARDIFIPEKGGLSYMSSNLQSTMHFSGKCHKKKLRQFMQDYCRQKGILAPRKARELMKDTPVVPTTSGAQELPKVDLYCKTCDLSFTSVTHASQHYAGKNHQRKLEGKPPLKSGYYNPRTGRWQRLPPGMEHERFNPRPPVPGLGLPRGTGPATTTTAAADPSVVTVQVAPGNLVNAGVKLSPAATGTPTGSATGAGAVQSKFYCDICQVSATCQLQLDTHMTGARHKLQAKKLGVPLPPPKPAATEATAAATTATTVAAAEPDAKKPRRDYSIYKTPSGKFYCLPCNMTMNSETQFAQHFESKKHQQEVAKQKKPPPASF